MKKTPPKRPLVPKKFAKSVELGEIPELSIKNDQKMNERNDEEKDYKDYDAFGVEEDLLIEDEEEDEEFDQYTNHRSRATRSKRVSGAAQSLKNKEKKKSEGQIIAQVIKTDKREFECQLYENIYGEKLDKITKATALGNLLKDDEGIVIGDWVYLEKIKNSQDEHKIIARHERSSMIFRHIQRERKKKIQAANVDLLVIVTSAELPLFRSGLVDRYITRAIDWQIRPIVVINKMDLYSPDNKETDLQFEIDRLANLLEVDVFEIAAKGNHPDLMFEGTKNFLQLKETLQGKMALFSGQSGVGKSETINHLSLGKYKLLTQKLSKVGKGSHTTTWSEIIDYGNFKLIDSPGIRSYSIDDLDHEKLIDLFPDLFEWAKFCQFPNCRHLENSKGCHIWHQFQNNFSQELYEVIREFFYELTQRETNGQSDTSEQEDTLEIYDIHTATEQLLSSAFREEATYKDRLLLSRLISYRRFYLECGGA